MTSPGDAGGRPGPGPIRARRPHRRHSRPRPDVGAGAVPPAGTPGQPAAPVRQHKVRRTRAGGVWVGLALGAVVLVLLLVFILENEQRANVGYFGAHGQLPLGVALLLAAVAGALLVIIPGTARIIQLRRTARRHRAVDAAAAAAAASTPPRTSVAPDTEPER